MKSIFQKIKTPLKLSLASLITTVFLHTSNSSCGSQRFGLPLRFIRTHCDCSEHLFPIDIMNLSIDMAYHMVAWSIIIYLWEDTKETWKMFKNKSRLSS